MGKKRKVTSDSGNLSFNELEEAVDQYASEPEAATVDIASALASIEMAYRVSRDKQVNRLLEQAIATLKG